MAQPSISTQPFPQLSTAVVEPDGSLARPWQRLLQNLWMRAGGSAVNNQTFVYLTLSGDSQPQINVNGIVNEFLGQLEFTNTPGQAAVPKLVGASPAVFSTDFAGLFAVESGQVEFSRDAGVTWYIVGLAGGLLACRAKDQIRVTYYRDVPKVTFFPD